LIPAIVTVSAAGITARDYAGILSDLQNEYWTIYGADAVLTADSQDGQLLAVFAQALYDMGQSCVAVYGSFSPATAQGAGLSSVVKINGIARKTPTASTATVTLIGVSGTTITGGLVGDNQSLSTQWALPASVTIPSGGSVSVTATCTTNGAISAAPATLVNIITPTSGWQSVSNASAAVPGAPIEGDAALRARQGQSVSTAAVTPLDAILGAVVNTTGVKRAKIFENDTDATDTAGRPPHSVTIVAEGGDPDLIAAAIASKKSPGTSTYGTTSRVVVDEMGVSNTINYYQLTTVPITLTITIKALNGYSSATADLIKAAVAEFISSRDIGETGYLNRLYAPANLRGDEAITATGYTQVQLEAITATYNVTSILQARTGSPTASDISISFYEAETCDVADIALVVT
jgi:uncharacterized phage protein gp47/JayE